MATWTDENKNQVIAAYKAANPTPETSTEIIKEIAEDMEATANGVRMILMTAGVYIKKDATATPAKGKDASGAEKAPRVSKESQIADLKAAIEAKAELLDAYLLPDKTFKTTKQTTSLIVLRKK